MEYRHGSLAAGRISLTALVDRGELQRYGVGMGGCPADGADGRAREAPSQAGETPRGGSALYSAAGSWLGPPQTRMAAAAACHALARLPATVAMGGLEAPGDFFVLDRGWD